MLRGLLDPTAREEARRQREKENYLYSNDLANHVLGSTDEFTRKKQIQNRRCIWLDPARVAKVLETPKSNDKEKHEPSKPPKGSHRIFIDAITPSSNRSSLSEARQSNRTQTQGVKTE